MDKLRKTQINPVLMVVVALIIALGCGYFFWLRPEQELAKIKREWNSPEVAQARSPEGKAKDVTPEHEKLLEQLRNKERASHSGTR